MTGDAWPTRDGARFIGSKLFRRYFFPTPQGAGGFVHTDLYCLIYISRNVMSGTAEETRAGIAQILAAARRHNPQRHVTGALLFSGGCFAQVLEGRLADVEETFTRIQPDPRHVDIHVLRFEPIEQRSFGNWSMAFAGHAPPPENLNVDGLLASPSQFSAEEAGRLVLDVLRDMIGNHEAASAA